MITVCSIGATLLQALDQTIANVALPYMQGSFSSSYDEVTRVRTSDITTAAIMTAPVGWMAVRFGRKKPYVTGIIGFTITSMLCRATQTLAQAYTLFDPAQAQGAGLLNQMVNQQAQIVAYSNDHVLMIFTTLPAMLLLLVIRSAKRAIAPVRAEPAA